jgi:uncharacterized membrane protein
MSDFDRDETAPVSSETGLAPREVERTTVIDAGGGGGGSGRTLAVVILILVLGLVGIVFFMMQGKSRDAADGIGVNINLPKVEAPNINVNLPDVKVDTSKVKLPDVDVKTEPQDGNKSK